MVMLKDIAKSVNVSKWTVSKVLNGDVGRISELTQKKVLACARKMNYQIDDMARAIKTGKSRSIAYLPGSNISDACNAIFSVADSRNFNVNLIYNQLETESDEIFVKIKKNRLSGVILHTGLPQAGNFFKKLKDANIPCASTATYELEADINIFPDNLLGGKLVAQHLIENNHKSFAIIGTTNKDKVAEMRIDGFKTELQKHGFTVKDKHQILVEGKDSVEVIKRALLKQKNSFPSAVFCTTDSKALCFYAIAGQCGFKIPKDIAVVGYGNIGAPNSTYLPITTVCENRYEISRICCQKLIDYIEIRNTNKLHKKYDVKLLQGISS